jgi:hypothetical protein
LAVSISRMPLASRKSVTRRTATPQSAMILPGFNAASAGSPASKV